MANQKQDAEIMALFCLGCVAQYFGFVAGPMDLWLFDPDQSEHEPAAGGGDRPHRADAARVYAALDAAQRPRLHFAASADEIAALPQKKAVIHPVDFLDGHGALVDQAAHWDLMSKRSLALSPELPSPATEVVDTQLRGAQVATLAATADQASSSVLLEAEAARMLAPVEARAVPFVVKMPLGLGGHSVFMVRDEARRAACLRVLREELPLMLRGLAPDNEHLTPPSLLLQEVVRGGTVGVSLFVTRAGRAVFLSCAEQIIDEGDNWAGGVIDYAAQADLAARYGAVVERVAAYVFRRGYHGPMGVDVMTTDDEDGGKQLIVDMNIRQTGDLTLGLLGAHFWEERGLRFGGLIAAMCVQGDRDGFEDVFAAEVESGALVIAGWTRAWAAAAAAGPGPEGELVVWSICSLLVGAEDRGALQELMDRVGSVAIVVKDS